MNSAKRTQIRAGKFFGVKDLPALISDDCLLQPFFVCARFASAYIVEGFAAMIT